MSSNFQLKVEENKMKFQQLFGISALITGVLALPASAIAESKNVNDLYYWNNGGYAVDYVQLYWKDAEGNKKHQKFDRNLTVGMTFCLDLKEFGKVPEGNEVWLKIQIWGGDKESCRKNLKLLYNESSNLGEETFRTEGTLFNNNRCEKGPRTDVIVGTSSGNCQYLN